MCVCVCASACVLMFVCVCRCVSVCFGCLFAFPSCLPLTSFVFDRQVFSDVATDGDTTVEGKYKSCQHMRRVVH